MKVLYIGNMSDGSGYATAGKDYCLAMDRAGVNVVPRLISFNNRKCPLPSRLTELMQQSVTDCNIVIQHTLPHLVSYDGHFDKSICLFAFETDNFIDSIWSHKLNLMDEVWTINTQQKESCQNSFVTRPQIKVIPHTTDVQKYKNAGGHIDLPCPENHFKFYTIAEFVRRKNLADLIKAFHIEFCPEEGVELVIKTSMPDTHPNELQQKLQQFCADIKKGLKLWRNENAYKSEIILTDFWSEKQILALHNTCHCFVTTSRGEAFNLGLMDAIGMSRPVIATNVGGHRDLVDDKCGILVRGRMAPCFGAVDSFVDLYTASSNWYDVDIIDLQHAMRKIYDEYREKTPYEERQKACQEKIQEFDYSTIGRLIKDSLEV